MGRILLIEDDKVGQALVTACLSNHETVVACDLKSARDHLAKSKFDLILLDVKLPDGDGFSFLIELQETVMVEGVPICMLTGQTQAADKVAGYSLGADDYITKPIDPIVFKTHIESKLKKRELKAQRSSVLKQDGLTLALDKQSATFETATGTHTLELTSLEFKILAHMLKHKDQVFSREQLIEVAWGNAVSVGDRTVDSHVSHLRKRLEKSNLTIQSVYGSGYKLTSSKKAA